MITAPPIAPRGLQSHATRVPLEDDGERVRSAMCPLCQTSATIRLDAGDAWRCGRCGQLWDSRRLGAVAGFEAWAALRRTTDARG
jgi:ribosomal protein L37AE/L43A